MRALIQRVSQAKVIVEDQAVGIIGSGLVVLLGVKNDDDKSAAEYLVNKIVNLRIFEDEAGRFNLSALDVGGEILAISQFTLYADCRKGRRPSFTDAAKPDVSEPLYNYFVEQLRQTGLKVATGKFGAHMDVALTNNGPVTIMLDSKDKR